METKDIITIDELVNSNNVTNEKDKKDKKNKKDKDDNCQELKNIAYKTMLINGNNINPTYNNSTSNQTISNFLEDESNANKKETWVKLDKTQKVLRLNNYSNLLVSKYSLSNNELEELKKYLIKCLDRRSLTKSKEVIYDKEKNIITNIPFLIFNEESRTFLLKKDDKHVSTIKSLQQKHKSKVKTIKNN